jgi:hypothetical protein
MENITEVFILLEDRPGSIYELTRILKKKKININAIGLFVDTARIHVDDPQKALDVIHENGLVAEKREVLGIRLPNRQGALMELTQKLGNAGINIKYLYGTMNKGEKDGLVILEVDQPQLAIDIFKNHKF